MLEEKRGVLLIKFAKFVNIQLFAEVLVNWVVFMLFFFPSILLVEKLLSKMCSCIILLTSNC